MRLGEINWMTSGGMLWVIYGSPEGVHIWKWYGVKSGCRLWTVPTIGM